MQSNCFQHLIQFCRICPHCKLQPAKPAEPEGVAGNEKEKNKEKKPPAETKAAILQSLRTKLNNLIQEDGKFLFNGWLYTI